VKKENRRPRLSTPPHFLDRSRTNAKGKGKAVPQPCYREPRPCPKIWGGGLKGKGVIISIII